VAFWPHNIKKGKHMINISIAIASVIVLIGVYILNYLNNDKNNFHGLRVFCLLTILSATSFYFITEGIK